MRTRIRSRCRSVAVIAAAIACLAPVRAFAGDEAPERQGASAGGGDGLLVRTPPAPTHRLRLALEEASTLALGYVSYSLAGSRPPYPGVPHVPLEDKARLSVNTWYFDNDVIGVNYVGHPVAGACYYLAARANHASAAEALLWTFGTSAVWETLEYREPFSLNDAWVTPVAGFAVGETLAGLSSYLDGARDPFSRTLAWVLDPFRKLNQLAEGGGSDRERSPRPWLSLRATASGGVLTQGGPALAAMRADLDTRLFRLDEDGETEGSQDRFGDGNASALAVTTTLAAGTAVDFRLETETALLGRRLREARRDGERAGGVDLLVLVTGAYEYGWHTWDLAAPRESHLAAVRFPGLGLDARLQAGELELSGSLDLAFTFAGVDPVGGDRALPSGRVYSTVQVASGYSHSPGFHAAPRLALRWRAISAGAEARIDELYAVVGGPYRPRPSGAVASMENERVRTGAWLRLAPGAGHLSLALRAEWLHASTSVEHAGIDRRVERGLYLSAAFAR